MHVAELSAASTVEIPEFEIPFLLQSLMFDTFCHVGICHVGHVPQIDVYPNSIADQKDRIHRLHRSHFVCEVSLG